MNDEGIMHEVCALNSLLKFIGNGAVEKAKIRVPTAFPKQSKERLPPMTGEERALIIRTAETVPDNDWKRLEAYAMTVMAICSGVRSKELRLTNLSDLDMNTWTLHAEEVKGKGRYGRPRDPPIDPDGHRFIERYVRVRNRVVSKNCPDNQALFPALGDRHGDGYFVTNSLARLRAIVKEETGVEFDGRTCRRTYAQKCIDDGMPVENVSLFLGHKTSKTTEESYCRKKPEKAIAEARCTWAEQDAKKHSPVPRVKEQPRLENNSLLIEKEKWIAGYA
ncbi:MAG: site-specific integrase [Methanomassiliicoccales archaeon]|nr:site-specific integrase [Methanomassiliicoccales archaeon]